jgi:hypothetical protein
VSLATCHLLEKATAAISDSTRTDNNITLFIMLAAFIIQKTAKTFVEE